MSENPNEDQIEYWDEVSGPKWVAMQAELDEQLAPLQNALIDFLAPCEGDTILDIGCGCGASTLALAQRVGDSGTVTGLDVSKPMLAHARHRATDTGRTNIQFNEGDAQTEALPNDTYDIITSRFGIMFFSDPVAAFANLKSSLKSDGKLAFMCWRKMEDNPWMTVPVIAAAAHVELPAPPEKHAPGPFAFADEEYLRGLLSKAGFQHIEARPFDTGMVMGADGDLDNSIDFMTKIGPLSRLLQEVDADTVAEVKESIRDALKSFTTSKGIELNAGVWLVRAQ
jgi:ubiquinone/menaquinone biosynthesis C-methylase UbiE